MNFIDLENEDFILQKITKADFDRLFIVASDPQIWEQHPDKNRFQLEGFTVYFDYLIKCEAPYLIIDKKTAHIIGATAFYQFNKDKSSVAIGYSFLARAYWGGYTNQSIKRLMTDYAFKFVDHVLFHVREKNFRSQAALIKIGALKQREYIDPNDKSALQYEYILDKPYS